MATRRGHIAWVDRDAHYQELFPPPNGNYPQLPALFPGSPCLYAADVSYDPIFDDDVPQSSDPASYTLCLATVNYKTIAYSQSGATGQIITRKKSISGEFMTYKNRGLEWEVDILENADGYVPIIDPEHKAGKLIPMREHSITLHRVVPAYYAYLDPVMAALVGKVNDAEFEGVPAESLLFVGGEETQVVNADGSQSFQVELKFMERLVKFGGEQVGWNYAYREEYGKWQRIRTTSPNPPTILGSPIYPLGDFTTLYA